MGPGTGLRQVSISRYSIGWWPSKVIAVLNVIEQIGWSSVGCITGGQALVAVSDGALGTELGVIIAAVCGFIVSFIGLKAVFTYEKFAGMCIAVIFVIMYGYAGYFTDINTPTELTGATLSGTSLTLFAALYGSSASWCSIVSDYYVEYPVNTSKVKVFIYTTLGIGKSPTSLYATTRGKIELTQILRAPNLSWHDPWRHMQFGSEQQDGLARLVGLWYWLLRPDPGPPCRLRQVPIGDPRLLRHRHERHCSLLGRSFRTAVRPSTERRSPIHLDVRHVRADYSVSTGRQRSTAGFPPEFPIFVGLLEHELLCDLVH